LLSALRLRRTISSNFKVVRTQLMASFSFTTSLGEHYVRDRGSKEVVIDKEQLNHILVEFDRADFFNLEDRAFMWGFHSPKVKVRITIDGKAKEVWGDTEWVGPKSGPQAKFVEAAAAIDDVAKTSQWTSCENWNSCRN
jgi:hypothetical protein